MSHGEGYEGKKHSLLRSNWQAWVWGLERIWRGVLCGEGGEVASGDIGQAMEAMARSWVSSQEKGKRNH